MIATAYAETLRRLALDDEAFLADVLGRSPRALSVPSLDVRTQALVRVGALVAIGASATLIGRAVADALAAGASPNDVVDILLTVAPTVGSARVVAAAPSIAAALGYDLVAALEEHPAVEPG